MTLTDGLVSYWKFDEGSGTTAFDSAGSNDLTVNSNIWTNDGKINGGWDNDTQYSGITDGEIISSGDGLAISGWFYFNNDTRTFYIANKVGGTGNNRFFIGRESGSDTNGRKIRFFTQNASENADLVTTQDTPDNEWIHITITRNGTTGKIYVNGQEQETTGTVVGGDIFGAGDWVIGASRGQGVPVPGRMDEFGIWNRVLTSTEISELYNDGDGLQYGTGTFVEPEPDLTNGLVSYYKMDTGSGTTAFDSVGENDGTLVNSPTWTTGKINDGLSFDGDDDYVITDTESVTSGGTITISKWIKFDRLDTNEMFFDSRPTDGSTSPRIFLLKQEDNTLRFFTSDGSTTFNTYSTSTVDTGVWYHLVFVIDDGTGYIYINNSLDNSSDQNTSGFLGTDQYLFGAGRDSDGSVFRHCQSIIDEIGIWNRALTSSEVSELYNDGDGLQYGQPGFGGDVTTKKGNIFFGFGGGKGEAPNPVPVPVAYWTLDTGSGDTAYDSVGDNDGTLSNTRIWTTDGKINGGADFTNGDDIIDLGNYNIGRTFTLNLWLNINTFSGDTCRFRQGNINFKIDNRTSGQISAEIYNGSSWQSANASVTSGNYVMITVISIENNNSLEIYANSVSEDSITGVSYTSDETIGASLGGYPTGVNTMDGLIDEVGIWNQALTQEQITYLWNNGDGARPAGV